jgi:methyl-accepting chemotaxis protein
MKNLKIRTKILLSFGIAIALMLVLSLFSVISSITSSGNARTIGSEVQLQTLASDLLDSFMAARRSSTVISHVFDDNEYQSLLGSVAEANAALTKMKELAAQDAGLAGFSQAISAVETQLAGWQTNVDGVQANNKELERIIAEAQGEQAALISQSMGIFNYQMELSREEARMAMTVPERLERVDRVELGNDIATRLNHIGSSFDSMFRSLDTSRVEQDKQYVVETVAVLEEFLAGSGLQFNIDTTTAMLAAIEVYNLTIDEFLTVMDTRARALQNASGVGDVVQALVDQLLVDVETSALDYINTTVGSNELALIAVAAIAVVVLIISIFLALYISGLISRPLGDMMGYIKQAGETGNLQFRDDEWQNCDRLSQSRDEIGQTMSAFTKMMRKFVYYGEMVNHVADQDLTVAVDTLGPNDTFGNAIARMTENLNGMFSDINASTLQVSTGSKQIADGAQALAQGSTQQAAAVEELSASIAEIAEKTKQNAEMAGQAATLADTILHNAEKGSAQMGQMMEAVKDINQASQSIGKVIKVIDDIAFQTNILALNAAVEAARAGQHGKGFAVVAEEVRSLASKSAAAAKDTAELIEDSLKKAALGSRIAAETSASLTEIVSGIGESDKIVGDIARSSEEQRLGIAQINRGIDQVAQVVQQNSATAEQSAAASEQMSGQSAVLQERIAQFKFKGGDACKSLLGSAQAAPQGVGGYGKY